MKLKQMHEEAAHFDSNPEDNQEREETCTESDVFLWTWLIQFNKPHPAKCLLIISIINKLVNTMKVII